MNINDGLVGPHPHGAQWLFLTTSLICTSKATSHNYTLFLSVSVLHARELNAVPRPGLEPGPFDQESSALSIRPPGLRSSNWRTRQLFLVAAILQRRGPGQLLQGFEPRIFRKTVCPLVTSLFMARDETLFTAFELRSHTKSVFCARDETLFTAFKLRSHTKSVFCLQSYFVWIIPKRSLY